MRTHRPFSRFLRRRKAAAVFAVFVCGGLVAGCESATAPPPDPSFIVTFEALTPVTSTGTVGTEVEPAPRLRVTDRNGGPIPGARVYFEEAGDGGTVRTFSLESDDEGIVTVAWRLGRRVGTYTLTAGSRSSMASLRFTATAGPGAPALLTPVGVPPAGTAGTALAQPRSVQVTDEFGNPVARATVHFTVISGGGSVGDAPTVSDASGIAASGVWTLGPALGTQHMRAQAGNAEVVLSAQACAGECESAGQILFVRHGSIYRVGADGTGSTRLTSSGTDQHPVWSADRQRIAFVRGAATRWETGNIHLMWVDDGEIVQRTTSGMDRTPAWSPDGARLAFSSWCAGQGCLLVLNADHDGAGPVRLGDPRGYHGDPSWSPDGTQLAFVSDYSAFDFVLDIYVTPANGGSITQLTSGFGFGSDLKWYLHPVWSPDGKHIAFVYGTVFNSASDMRFRIAIMDADGSNRRDLAWAGDIPWTGRLDPGALSWSPDGRRIAFTFVDCDRTAPASCSNHRSIKYVSLDGEEEGIVVLDGSDPSWR